MTELLIKPSKIVFFFIYTRINKINFFFCNNKHNSQFERKIKQTV
jgi:hypothetical protein